jgi:hypothetical protein
VCMQSQCGLLVVCVSFPDEVNKYVECNVIGMESKWECHVAGRQHLDNEIGFWIVSHCEVSISQIRESHQVIEVAACFDHRECHNPRIIQV